MEQKYGSLGVSHKSKNMEVWGLVVSCAMFREATKKTKDL